MKIKGSTYFLVVIMLFLFFVLGWSVFVMQYFEAKLLPLVIGTMVLILVGVQFVRELSAKNGATATTSVDEYGGVAMPVDSARPYLVHGAWITAFVLGIYVLGFILSIILFVLLYMKRLGTTWREAILYAVISPAFIYALFELALDIELYRGLLFDWLS